MYRRISICLGILFWASSVATGQQAPPVPSPVVHFAVIGDRTGGHQPGVYERIIAQVERLRPDFAVTVGDHIEGYSGDTVVLNSQWGEYFSIVKPLTMPLYLTPGNHDITTDAQLPTFRKVVGEPYRSFDIGTMHFIILDNSRWESSALLPKEQLDWLVSDLQRNSAAGLTFVFFHKPFWYNTISMGKPDALHTLFVKYGVDAVFSGHFHQYFSGKFDGILYTAVGSSGAEMGTDPAEIGYHFAWVTVDRGTIEISPVKIDAVQPWSVLDVADLHVFDQISTRAIQISSAVPVASDLTVPSTAVAVEFDNSLGASEVRDTARWTIPAGWSVEPASLEIALPAKGKKTATFQVKGTGALYPVPALAWSIPLGSGKPASITRELRVARTIECGRTQTRPTIDGKLTEAVWKNPTTALFSSDGSPAAIESTYCYFAYDENNLYVAAKCRESKPDSIVAGTTMRDGSIFGEDCVGYFFQPNCGQDTAYQIYFSAIGTVFDQKLSRPDTESSYLGDRSWNGSYSVRSGRENGYWTVEAQIPLRQFGIRGTRGTRCGINFLRKQQHLKGAADWQVPIDYDPLTFGVLLFQ